MFWDFPPLVIYSVHSVSLSVILHFSRLLILTGSPLYWHLDPLLGNDREIGNYTTAVAKVGEL
jgi:hypothetical protein